MSPSISHNIYHVFDDVPFSVAVLMGESLNIEFINQFNLNVWQLTKEQVLGKPLFDVHPHLQSGPGEMHREVYRTGKRVIVNEIPVKIYKNGALEEVYFNAVIDPLFNDEGQMIGQLATSFDMTDQVLARKKLEVSEEKYRELFETMDQGFCIIEMIFDEQHRPVNYRFLESNSTFEGQTGLYNAIGKTALDLVPNLEETWFKRYGEVAITGKPLRFVEGSEAMNRWFEVYAFRLGDKAGKNVALLFTDISERKKSERDLNESEQRFRNLADESPMFVFIIEPDKDANISYWNKTWLKYTGQTLEEAQGRAWNGIIHPDDLQIVLRNYVTAFENIQPYTVPAVRVKRHDGEYRWHTFKGNPRYQSDEKFNGYVGVGFDIHEQRLAEEAIKENEFRFRTLANSIPQLAWMTDAEGWIYWYNQRWYEYTGTRFEDMQGWGWQKVHHPDLIDGVTDRFKSAIASGKDWEDTFLLRGKDGVFRWFLSRALPIRNEDGTIVQWFGTNTDISAQRQIEEALKNAKDQLELTFQNVPSAIYHFDQTGKILYLNERAASQMGYSSIEEVLAEKDLFQLRKRLGETFYVFDEDGQPLTPDQSSAAITLKTHKPSEVICQFVNREKRTSFWLLVKSSPLFNEKGELAIVLTTATDITLQKTSEQSIRESEEKFRTLTETLPQLVWITNEKGEQEYASSRWEDYTGIQPTGENTWHQMVHPDDLLVIGNAWIKSIETGTEYKSEARLKNKNGEYRWHFVQGEPIKDQDGAIIKWIGAFTDIHEQKTVEEKLERLVSERTKELERSNEDLQQFAHVASHDLKEPVRKMRTFANRLQSEYGDLLPDKGKTYLSKIESAGNRIYSMIDGVLLYSSLDAVDQTQDKVDLNETIRSIISDMEVLIMERNALIRFNGLPVITGSSILMYQLFFNLIQNSIKFAKEEMQPEIYITSASLSAAEIRSFNFIARESKYVRITLTDNGIGFDKDDAVNIFCTFSRLHSKDRYEGTGLGLALCKKIVERHHGIITATGIESGGASFEIILPVTQ